MLCLVKTLFFFGKFAQKNQRGEQQFVTISIKPYNSPSIYSHCTDDPMGTVDGGEIFQENSINN